MGCKVDTLVERHGLTVPDPGYDTVDEYLVVRWTGNDGRSPDGYKSLTEWFNKRVLKRIYEDHGRDTVSVHLDREYEVITDGEGIERDELAADLATDGIDVDDVADELVSWSTMRHHLKGCLDATKEQPTASTDWERETVQMAEEQAKRKTQSVLSSLASKERVPNAERAEVDVQIKLSCPECSVRVPFDDAIERGYLCETHLEEESTEGIRERVQNNLSSFAIPCGVLELFQTAFFEDPFVLDTVTATVL